MHPHFNLLKENENIFGEKITEMERTRLVEQYIDVGDIKPIHQKPYRLLQTQREVLDKEINRMLAGKIIEGSVNPWTSPVIIVT